MTREPDRRLCALILSALRKARGPLTTRDLAERFGVFSRRVTESIQHLRKEGWRITEDGEGHTLVRGRRQIDRTIQRMRSRVAELSAAIRGMSKGRSSQTSVPATRRRRAA